MSNEILHERVVSELAPNAWMNLVRSAQSKCVLDAAEGFFRRQLRKQMTRAVFLVASSDSDDDEVIFVSQVPPRR